MLGRWADLPDLYIADGNLCCPRAPLGGLKLATRPMRNDADGGRGEISMEPAVGSNDGRIVARWRVDDVPRNVPRETLPCPLPSSSKTRLPPRPTGPDFTWGMAEQAL